MFDTHVLEQEISHLFSQLFLFIICNYFQILVRKREEDFSKGGLSSRLTLKTDLPPQVSPYVASCMQNNDCISLFLLKLKARLKHFNSHCPNKRTHHLEDMWPWFNEHKPTVYLRGGCPVPPTAVLKLRQFRSTHICLLEETKNQWSLLSGVYARGSKRSHTRGKCVTCSGLINFLWTLNTLQRRCLCYLWVVYVICEVFMLFVRCLCYMWGVYVICEVLISERREEFYAIISC